MHTINENKKEYLFIYERSRYRSAVGGVIICSILVGALGIFTWPIVRDMRSSWGDMFQSAAWILAAITLLAALVWFYFVLRMFVSGTRYLHGLKERQKGRAFTLIALIIACAFVAATPVAVFLLHLV